MKRKRHNVFITKGHKYSRFARNNYIVTRCACGWSSSGTSERAIDSRERGHWMFVTGFNHDKYELVT